MRHGKFYFSIVAVLLSADFSLAAITCFDSLSDKTFKTLQSQHQQDLPQDILAAIREIAPRAQNTAISIIHKAPPGSGYDDRYEAVPVGRGENFVIGLEHLDPEPLYLGENIAAQFIAKIFRALYPKAILENGQFGDINLRTRSI